VRWHLDWNALTDAEKSDLIDTAEVHVCSCCGYPSQAALALFDATVRVIEARDRREVAATLGSGVADSEGGRLL
jgi:hypothetical protein